MDKLHVNNVKYFNTLCIYFNTLCSNGHLKEIKKAVKKGGIYNWNLGLRKACGGGHLEIVNYMIEKGANDWNEGLCYACKGGHLEIVKLMIEKGANEWNYGLEAACYNGNIKSINLMIEKGANEWNEGLRGACKGGHLEIVNLMIEKGANKLGDYIEYIFHMEYKDEIINGVHQLVQYKTCNNRSRLLELMIKNDATNLYRVRNSDELDVYKIYCKYNEHDNYKLNKLITEQCPIYTLIINKKYNKTLNKLPMELFRLLKTYV